MSSHSATASTRRWRTRLLSIGLLVAALGAAPVAEAQSRAELAEARELFTQGLAAAREAHWVEARELFERSLAITERASTLLNLAAALAETGALRDSARRYERFLEIANGRDARHRPEARRALERVQARTPRLALDTTALEPGDRVEIDGEAVGAPREPLALDPGAHHVAVRRSGDTVFEEHVTLAEGAHESMVLTPRVVVASPREAALAAEAEPTDEAGGGDDGVAIGVGIGVGVAVVAAVAIVLAVVLGGETQDPFQGNLGDGVIRY
ncbi:MAG: hypothetical protein KC619_18330 [Myxococcales bacterium]|nr:hypothetical protein [Myxococcales bacterium]